MATLHKEVWVRQIMEGFYPDTSFLKYARDFSGLVEYNKINLADAGVDPEVLINNTTYPIKVSQRVDKPLEVELDLFETENTLIRYPEAIEYSYNQLESVVRGHRNVLRAKTGAKAASAYAPQKDTTDTPVISTSGATFKGRKRMTVDDILYLKERFDDMNIPVEGRYLVLNPKHLSDLILFDVNAFKNICDIRDGKPQKFAGFNMLQSSLSAVYNSTTMEKVAFGTAAADTDTFCSFAFNEDEVMKADGDVKMYARYDDPEERGTIVGFDKRFIAVPIRDKGIGAIVSTKVDE